MTGMIQDKRTVLKNRAKVLARVHEIQADNEDCLEVVAFTLAGEKYAIESVQVREVYALRDLTPLPCTPPFVLGIINCRGQILAVIDIRSLFDLPVTGLTDAARIIIIAAQDAQVGLLADSILGVRQIPAADLQPSLPTLTGIRAEYLCGVTSDQTAVLNAAAILSNKKLVLHEEIET